MCMKNNHTVFFLYGQSLSSVHLRSVGKVAWSSRLSHCANRSIGVGVLLKIVSGPSWSICGERCARKQAGESTLLLTGSLHPGLAFLHSSLHCVPWSVCHLPKASRCGPGLWLSFLPGARLTHILRLGELSSCSRKLLFPSRDRFEDLLNNPRTCWLLTLLTFYWGYREFLESESQTNQPTFISHSCNLGAQRGCQ